MLLSKILEELLWGMGTSIEIFLLTLLFSIPLGLAVAAGRMSSFKPLQLLMKAYISIMRGTPLMLQLIVVFFGPYYIFGMTLSRDFRMIAVIIAFTINYAAYFAEIFRGGIESIPNGQYEAAQVLGYDCPLPALQRHSQILTLFSMKEQASGICQTDRKSVV